MKEFKHLTLGGLQQKILNLVLITIGLIMAVFLAVSLFQVRSQNRLIQDTTDQQKDSIAGISTDVMDSVIDRTLKESTNLEAYIADNLFTKLSSVVEAIQHYATEVYSHADEYAPHPIVAPEPSPDGTGMAQVQLMTAEGVDLTSEEIAEKVGLLGNMSNILMSTFSSIYNVDSCFIGTPDGLFLIADDRADLKYGEGGELIHIPVTERPWYTGAVEAGGMYFTGIEEDTFTGRIGIVCSAPVYADGELVAVAGADLFLDSMADAVNSTGDDSSFVCIIGPNGRVIFSPKTEGTFAVKGPNGPDLRRTDNAELGAFIEMAMQGNTNVKLISVDDTLYYMAGAPIKSVGWILISTAEQAVTHEPTDIMLSEYDHILSDAQKQSSKSFSRHLTTAIILVVAAIILALIGAILLSRRIVRPIENITKKIALNEPGTQVFQMDPAYRTGDEIEVMAESFADLSARTKKYIEDITRITAENERIGTELELANRIQANMLPSEFPPFPNRKEFDIYASMKPAKEVAGDFYDFFLIDDDHLALVMADVSGKGVPAALFMMMSKILVSNNTQLNPSPAQALEQVNAQLCQNNAQEMFVTVWLGILTISTGHIVAANAGHEYPAIRPAGGRFELMKDAHSFIVGGMEETKYKEYEFTLEHGGTLFLYTDGVPEAANASDELFGTDRMLDALNADPDVTTRKLLEKMENSIREFTGDTPASDDMTMMAITLK